MSTFNAGGIVGQELGAALTQALGASTHCTQAATHAPRLQPYATGALQAAAVQPDDGRRLG
jgi:hypothetical protein